LNIWIAPYFVTFIKKNILVTTNGRVRSQEMSKPFHRRRFQDTAITVLGSCKVIGNKNPTSLTIETLVINTTISSLEAIPEKAKSIERHWYGRVADRVELGPTGDFVYFACTHVRHVERIAVSNANFGTPSTHL